MSLRLACEASETFSAVATVAGGMAASLAEDCVPLRAIPVLLVNGRDDGLVPWDGEKVVFKRRQLGTKLTVPATVAHWVKTNACAEKPTREELPDRSDDGTTSSMVRYPDCVDDAEVRLVEVHGGGHTWPGGWQYLPESAVGRTSRDVDAAELAWKFFQARAGP